VRSHTWELKHQLTRLSEKDIRQCAIDLNLINKKSQNLISSPNRQNARTWSEIVLTIKRQLKYQDEIEPPNQQDQFLNQA